MQGGNPYNGGKQNRNKNTYVNQGPKQQKPNGQQQEDNSTKRTGPRNNSNNGN